MKLSEINFKTICGNEERALAIQKALFERGGTWKDKTTSLLSNPYWCLIWDGDILTWGDLSDFLAKPQRELTLAQALVEINKCEIQQKDAGKWIECDIDAQSGLFQLDPGRPYSWWNWQSALIGNSNLLFGGWYFTEDGNGYWDSRYMSKNKEGHLFSEQGCDRVPVIPVKIRFWRPAK